MISAHMYHCNWYVCTDAHLFFEPSCVLLGCTETEPKLYLAHYPHMCSTAHVQCQDFTQEKRFKFTGLLK